MTVGTMMMIAGITCCVLGVLLFFIFFVPARKMFMKKADKLINEYSCEGQENR